MIFTQLDLDRGRSVRGFPVTHTESKRSAPESPHWRAPA